MEPTTFTLALDAVDPAVSVAPSQLRRARNRVWRIITARFWKHLSLHERVSLGAFTVDGDATHITARWDAPPSGPARLAHLAELAAAMEEVAVTKVLAPLGLRPRSLRVGLDALDPVATACGLCRAARSEPMRWLALPPESLDALRSLTVSALRAAPDDTIGTLTALLASPDRGTAVAAADALTRLLRPARAAERSALVTLVVAAWRHPDEHVARAALRCAQALGTKAPAGALDAWVDAVRRFRDDDDALAVLAPLARAAVRSNALAAALSAWLRSSHGARRFGCARLSEILYAAPAKWSPGHAAAFAALVAAAEEEVSVEYVPLLLRYMDRLTAAATAALLAWLDAADAELVEVARDLFAQQPSHPALDAACLRLLRQPSPEAWAHGFAIRNWAALDDARYSAAVDLLLTAAAQADGTPVDEALRLCLDQMLCHNLGCAWSATPRLAAVMLAPGTSDARLDATAEHLLGWWANGLRDEKLRVVEAFVNNGHTAVLSRAFRTFAKRNPRGEGAARVARLGLGLSWSMQRAGAWAEGGEVAGVAAAIAPDASRPNLLYNQACGFAMTCDAEGTARVLGEAIALDPKQADDARADADFAPVRSHPALVALLGPAD